CSRLPPPPALPSDPPLALASGISSGPSVRLEPPTFHRLSPLRLLLPINSRLAPQDQPSDLTFELSARLTTRSSVARNSRPAQSVHASVKGGFFVHICFLCTTPDALN